jgi:hypothetical protein
VTRGAALLRLALPAALAALVASPRPAGADGAPATAPARPAPTPETAAEAPDVEGAIRRAADYLLGAQNRDGSWGTPASNLWDIYAPVPGSYHAFHVASSALALSGLLDSGLAEGDPKVAEAIRRGTEFLLSKHAVRRVSSDTLYNTWAHAYALAAFARLLAREDDEARRGALVEASERAVDLLRRFEFVDGGWGYYDFDVGAARPGPGATSFTTATVLAALAAARAQGVRVPDRMLRRAVKTIRTCEKPDGAFVYSVDLRFLPHMGVNKVKGSLARTPACLAALRGAGEDVPVARVRQALDELETFGHFLLIARKYPVPHEAWYQNSGYFCFYGYHYATALFEALPEEDRAKERERIARRLVPLQEKDGSFWDYQLYGYHRAYGTGYVLIALSRCRPS